MAVARKMNDILLGMDNDLLLDENGGLVYGESTRQHQKLLLICDKLSFKESPTMCVGAQTYLDDESKGSLAAAISVEFARDGMLVQSVKIEQGQIKTNANYI